MDRTARETLKLSCYTMATATTTTTATKIIDRLSRYCLSSRITVGESTGRVWSIPPVISKSTRSPLSL